MRIENLHYGDILQSRVRPDCRVMFLAPDNASRGAHAVVLGGWNGGVMPLLAPGSVIQLIALVVDMFDLVQAGPELSRMV